jgi:DNA-binding LytR/AlgR family response regulator
MIDDFAIALQLGANDFLRKPIGRETLLARVKNNLPDNRNRITAPGCWTIYCHLDKIVYIHSEKTGSRIYLEGTERTIEIETSFATIKDEFRTQLFSPHQNYLINTAKRARIRNRTNWDFELVFDDGKVVPISRRIYPAIKDNYARLEQ